MNTIQNNTRQCKTIQESADKADSTDSTDNTDNAMQTKQTIKTIQTLIRAVLQFLRCLLKTSDIRPRNGLTERQTFRLSDLAREPEAC